MLKWGIAGAGNWVAEYHLPVLRKLQKELNISLHGIWNRTPEKAAALAKKFGIQNIYSSYEEMLNDRTLDCISIIMNKSVVSGYIQKAIKRNLPFLVEKPPAGSFNEAQELIKLVQNVPHIVGFNRRYSPLVNRCLTLLKETSSASYKGRMWRLKRNDRHFIYETGIHIINTIEYLFGPVLKTEIEKNEPVRGEGCNVTVRFKHPHAEGIIHFHTHARESCEFLKIDSSETSIDLDIRQPYANIPTGSIKSITNGMETILEDSNLSADDLRAFGFIDEYREMVQIIQKSGTSRSDLHSAASSLMIAEQIERSLSNQN